MVLIAGVLAALLPGLQSTRANLLRSMRLESAMLPPSSLSPMTERMKLPQWLARTTAGFFLICGTLDLILASIGLFGAMYFTVSQCRREFGIRTALGASAAGWCRWFSVKVFAWRSPG